MGGPRTYTLSELETRSDFDKRTIAYYVQESLLPKVGRRGRRTRYSQEFLDRLMFIRRVRDLQDTGKLRAVTLSEIRDVLARQSAEEVRAATLKSVSAETLRDFFAEPDLDTSEFAIAAEEVASLAASDSREFGSAPTASVRRALSPELSASMRTDSTTSRSRSLSEAEPQLMGSRARRSVGPSDPELQKLLQEVERRARLGAKHGAGQTRERLTRVPITEDILLSVRNISDDDAHLVEELAEFLRRIGRLD
jgi:DNA-binding transcriptional MerR regulator